MNRAISKGLQPPQRRYERRAERDAERDAGRGAPQCEISPYRRPQRELGSHRYRAGKIHITWTPDLPDAGFSIKQEPDGLSISIHGLVSRYQLRTRDLCKDWNAHGVARFMVCHIRPDTGVIGDETDDPLMGKAHGLIRGPDGIPPQGVWNKVRDDILQNLDYFESEPEP